MENKNIKIELIQDYYYDEEILKADGLDDAVIGIDDKQMRLIYSKSKIIDILMVEWGLNKDDAEEWYWFNIHNAWVGEKTPIWCIDEWTNQNKDEVLKKG